MLSVNATWLANTATFTSVGHPFQIGQPIVVSGINPVGYNGTYIITLITANTFDVTLTVDPGLFIAGGLAVVPSFITSTATDNQIINLDIIPSAAGLNITTIDGPRTQINNSRFRSNAGIHNVNVSGINCSLASNYLGSTGTSGTITLPGGNGIASHNYAATSGGLITLGNTGLW